MIALLLAAALASPVAPLASEAYAVVRAGDSKMTCAELRASVEAIEAEIVAQDKAYSNQEMARISAPRRNLSGRGATTATAVSDRQAVILRQTEMNQRTSHLRQIYFARNCGAPAAQ